MFNSFNTLKSKYQNAQRAWQSKSPADKWDTIHNIGRFESDIIGIRLFSDMKVNWYSASCGVLIVIFFLLDIYTIQYYLRRNEFVRGMECTYVVGIVVAVS